MKNLIKKLVISILIWEAKRVINRQQPKIIAITGSVGKTQTKDAVVATLFDLVTVRGNQKSYNSEFGVPLTILNLSSGWSNPWSWFKILLLGLWRSLITIKNYPSYLVLEIGADHPNDIKKIMTWLKPDIGIITRLPNLPVHVEYFSGPEAVIAEKMALAENVKPTGVVILNADDPIILAKRHLIKVPIITYGLTTEAKINALPPNVLYEKKNDLMFPVGLATKITLNQTTFPFVLTGTIGEHQLYAPLAGLGVALSLGLDQVKALASLKSHYEVPAGRLRLVPGFKNSLILDDSYNSSPVAVKSALTALSNLTVTGHKIAILGDMLELGIQGPQAHLDLGKQAGLVCSTVVAVGQFRHDIKQGALASGLNEANILLTETATEAGDLVYKLIKPGDVILIKGSQGIRLEKAVALLIADPNLKTKFLCRQDEVWKKID